MIRRTLVKAVTGTLVAAGVVAAASLGTAGSVALSAYNTGTTTSTDTTNTTPGTYYGAQPQVTAKVTSVGSPTGSVTFTITTGPTLTTPYATSTVSVSASGLNQSSATYTFPAGAPADSTYKIVTSFTGTGDYQNSSDAVGTTVIINKYATSTTTGTVTYTDVGSNNYRVTIPVAVSSTPSSSVSGALSYDWFYGNGSNASANGLSGSVTSGSGTISFVVPKNKTGTATITFQSTVKYRSSTIVASWTTPN